MAAAVADGAPAPSPSPDAPASTSDIVHATNLSTCVLVVLVVSWTLGGHQLAQRCKYLTEGSAACALGLITGVVLLAAHHFFVLEFVTQLLEFNAAGFFTYLLPPVIFYAGLSVERSRFFLALPSILMYGVFGTLASFLIISAFMYLALGFALFKMEDCLAMGAIFAATDSVATLQVLDRDAMPSLFALVFGEGVVNDAVSVVLLGAVANAAHAHGGSGSGGHRLAGGVVANFVWLLVTSLLLGGAAGLAIAAALKRLQLKGAHQELSVITLLSYLSYLLADLLGLSAILALFVCGVVVSHYALHNISGEGRLATLSSTRTASYLAEGIIFIYVGMDSIDPLKWQAANALEAVWLVVVLTVLLVAARAAFVVPFSLLHNLWSAPAERLSARDVATVWWAGLMRGAVSVALVYLYFDDNARQQDRGRATLIVTTLMVVMLSILGGGALTKPLLSALHHGCDAEAAALAAHLSRIPLLGNIARSASGANLLDSFTAPGSGLNTPQHSRHNSAGFGGSTPAQQPRGPGAGAGGGGGMVAAVVAAARGEGGTWGGPGGGARGPHGSASSLADAAGGVGLQQLAAANRSSAPSAGRKQPQQPQFSGLDMDEDAQLIDPGDFGAAVPSSSSHPQQQQQQQQQQPDAHQVHLGAVELQQHPGSMVAAMRHVGEVWDVFDRSVMQPVFGGPGAHSTQPPQPPQPPAAQRPP